MQLHDILLLRTSASLHSVSVGAKPLSTGQCAPCRRLYQLERLTPTTDTSLFLTTYRGGSHLPANISPTYPEKNNPTAGTIASVPARDYFMVYKMLGQKPPTLLPADCDLHRTPTILHGNPAKCVCHGTCQNNHSKNRAEIFNHDYKYLLSAERSFPMSDFLFYAVYANYF